MDFFFFRFEIEIVEFFQNTFGISFLLGLIDWIWIWLALIFLCTCVWLPRNQMEKKLQIDFIYSILL